MKRPVVLLILALALLLGGCGAPFDANNSANTPEQLPPLIPPVHDKEDEAEKAPAPLPKDPLVGDIIEEDNSSTTSKATSPGSWHCSRTSKASAR